MPADVDGAIGAVDEGFAGRDHVGPCAETEGVFDGKLGFDEGACGLFFRVLEYIFGFREALGPFVVAGITEN